MMDAGPARVDDTRIKVFDEMAAKIRCRQMVAMGVFATTKYSPYDSDVYAPDVVCRRMRWMLVR